jgi:hypothetical protein
LNQCGICITSDAIASGLSDLSADFAGMEIASKEARMKMVINPTNIVSRVNNRDDFETADFKQDRMSIAPFEYCRNAETLPN